MWIPFLTLKLYDINGFSNELKIDDYLYKTILAKKYYRKTEILFKILISH